MRGTFNPRSYKRSDKYGTSYTSAELTFNPRSYKRSDNTIAGGSASTFAFNPRSYKRSDVKVVCFLSFLNFQSTLLQEERQGYFSLSKQNGYLSIHAPTRGATTDEDVINSLVFFQSTLLQEERPDIMSIKNGVILSIHAPTRGATYSTPLEARKVYTFNPRSYKRSDV